MWAHSQKFVPKKKSNQLIEKVLINVIEWLKEEEDGGDDDGMNQVDRHDDDGEQNGGLETGAGGGGSGVCVCGDNGGD